MKIISVDEKGYVLENGKVIVFHPFYLLYPGTPHRLFVERVLGRSLTSQELLRFDSNSLIGKEVDDETLACT